jgi:hypothetical protein
MPDNYSPLIEQGFHRGHLALFLPGVKQKALIEEDYLVGVIE